MKQKFFIALFLAFAGFQLAPAQEFVPLYAQGKMPNSKGMDLKEEIREERIYQVGKPGIHVFLPDAKKNKRAAVLVIPGGGYARIAFQGARGGVAQWLNSMGIAAFALDYRLPTSPDLIQKEIAPLQDAERALKLIRANAEKWNIDPNKIGVLGTSAGGHAASFIGTSSEDFAKIGDDIDKYSFTPNFMILISPVISMGEFAHSGSRKYLLGEAPSEALKDRFSTEKLVTPKTPPAFLVHAADDKSVNPKNSLLFYSVLLEKGVSSSLHVYPQGGHSIGVKSNNPGSTNTWMNTCELWLAEIGILSEITNSVTAAPKTLILDTDALLKNKVSNDPSKKALIKSLLSDADKVVKSAKVYSVTTKQQVPPSGDKHDYMSQGPYWWADPTKPDGLPYIRKDGQRNPEINKLTDADEMDRMLDDSELCAVAYFLSGKETYAKHAADILNTWFIDPKTRQNPNLNFGQGIPGIATGRGFGLIETREMYRAIDAAILIEGSGSWSAEKHNALKNWFANFASWMLESQIGKEEIRSKNNHGTYYDVQILAYTIFSGKPEIARKHIEVSKGRIASQIEKDGSLPLELARTLSFNYTNMNLYGFMLLAKLAERIDTDLWNYQKDGRGIKSAIDWLKPFAAKDSNWKFQQIKPREFRLTVEIFKLAGIKYSNKDYADVAEKLSETTKLSPLELLAK